MKCFKSFLCLFTCFALWAACSSYAEEEILYKDSYVCRDTKGRPRWQAAYELRRKEDNTYGITEKGQGRYFGFKGKVSWIGETEFEGVDGTIRPLWMKKRISDEQGKTIVIQEQAFNFNDNVVTCTHEDLIKNTLVEKKFNFKGNIVNRLLQGLYVQKLIKSGDTHREVQFISPEPALYNLDIKLLGTEVIDINDQKVKAYKLCLDPMLGMLNFVKILLPKAYVWHSAEPRFEWLKYEGVENSIKSPEVVITTLEEIVSPLKNRKEKSVKKASARHILVDSKEACEDLKSQIEKGADFAKLAKAHSKCPSGKSGGDLGEFTPGQMVKEFNEVVFSAELNKVQGPVKTDFGYHLIEVTNRDE